MSSHADNSNRLTVPMEANTVTVANPLAEREPDLAQRLAAFRSRVNDLLLDHLAAVCLHIPQCGDGPKRHSLPEVKATALVLHMLTKESWSQNDFKLFDACWREATHSDLFGDEFEADRHRLQECIAATRKKLFDKNSEPNRC